MGLRSFIGFVMGFLFASVEIAAAHPLGNFSINQYSAIRVGKQEVELRYIIDMAEIPTFQEIQETGLVPKADDASAKPYAARKAESLRAGLSLEINGQAVGLRTESYEMIFPDGAGGLPTLKIAVVYNGKLAADTGAASSLNYRDGNFAGRAGWKEIIATAETGVKLLSSSVPHADRSAELSNYPTDLLDSPPQQLKARVSFSVTSLSAVAGQSVSASRTVMPTTAAVRAETKKPELAPSSKETGPAAQTQLASSDVGLKGSSDENSRQLKVNSQATPRNSFTEIMTKKELGLGIILTALAIAVGLGAFHALEPGHGKTLVAAYLVGSRGTFKHAFLLGLIVTASHTASVYLLGAITLYASQYIVPERLYPWLGAISGAMIASLGLILLVRRYQGRDGLLAHSHHHYDAHDHGAHGHHHPHEHEHAHGHHHHNDHGHGHDHHGVDSHDHHELKQDVSLKQLLTLGISGGIVPCPAALVVLLSAVAMQRIGFGLLLIVAFSVGLAAVLIAVGMLMVYARQFMARFQGESQWATRWLPMTSSAFILLAGIALTYQALQSSSL